MTRLAFLAALPLLAACHREPPPPAQSTLAKTPVSVAAARRADSSVVQEVVGTVRPKVSSSIAPNVMGTVKKIEVTLGSRVRAGDVLVRLRAGEIDAKARQTAAVLDQAKIELARAKSLEQRGVISKSELDATTSRFRVADASHGEARVMQGYTAIRAPFAGVVTAKLAEAGDQALPGRPLLILEDPTALRLEASVPEVMAAGLRAGQKLAVRLDGSSGDLEGTVAEISPSAEASSRTVLVKLDLPQSPGLRAGMFGRVRLTTGERRALEVPAAALVQRGQLEMVFVAQADKAALRLVRSGRTRGGSVEISSGLDEAERVVVSHPSQLSDGQPIEVRP
ncbi:MAG: efflux RND transporter periplasmic adaptor subunit [Polyangiaceae bacterium]|nr:efflux RND transporter periplasmic adaptor subunit [Polyangiaceae bacterium]